METDISPKASYHGTHSHNLYYRVLLLVELCWMLYMWHTHSWGLFMSYWPATITMVFGAMVAGATAEGGAFVAFPVFTKVLNLSSMQSSTFGLMIQSVGMSAASVFILSLRIPILFQVIKWVSVGSLFGIFVGIKYIQLPDLYAKIIFTGVVSTLAVALIINRWWFNRAPKDVLDVWGLKQRLVFCLVGLVGGIFASKIGTGTNILTFIVLTVVYDINEKIAVPTSVVCMAINSVCGFLIHYVNGSIGGMWNYWLVAVPVVAIFAPLGSYIAHKITRNHLLLLLLVLILLEFVSTLFLLPFTLESLVLFFCVIVLGAGLVYLMLRMKMQKIR